MSAQIKLSYTDDEELKAILDRLGPIVKKHKVAKNQAGRFKNAYIDLVEQH